MNLFQPHIHGKKDVQPTSPPSATTTRAMSEQAGSDSSTPSDALLTPSSDVSQLNSQADVRQLPTCPRPAEPSTLPIHSTAIAIVGRADPVNPPNVPKALSLSSVKTASADRAGGRKHPLSAPTPVAPNFER